MITSERRYLQRGIRAMRDCTTDGHANFVYLPAAAGRDWHEVFDTAGVQARHYADGGVRVTVGARASTRAVIAALNT